MRYWKIVITALALGVQLSADAAEIAVKLYRNPTCGCCEVYARYLRSNGFAVEIIDTTDLTSIKQKYAVPSHLEGCHTAIIGDYVFEGLIPADQIKRVLNEQLKIKGLSVPGMAVGAPGMPGDKRGPINVYSLEPASPPKVFATF
jgi:hypothetical protein